MLQSSIGRVVLRKKSHVRTACETYTDFVHLRSQVKAVGDIHTYSGYPVTTNFITLTSNTFATTTSSAQVKLPLPSRTATSLLPHASGTAQNCFAYKNYREIPAIVDQSQSTELALYTSFINSCDYTTSTWSVALEDMIAWNPSLDRNTCTMKPGFSYCVLKDENYKPSKQSAHNLHNAAAILQHANM
jgi:hypothetical protein